jgi:8-oxo-dGTP pyrophosphatase MutT (NUDIX family)
MRRSAGIIYTDGKKILLLKRSEEVRNSGMWAPVAGKMEDDEDWLEVAKRESKEEIGTFTGKKIAEFQIGDNFKMFIYKVPQPFEVKLNDEHTKYEWVPLKDVKDYKLHHRFEDEWSRYLLAIERNNHSFKEWFLERINQSL